MENNNYIAFQYKNNIHFINIEPYESIDDTYKRAWYIVKNYDNYSNYNELYSKSIINKNINNGMIY